MACWKENNLKKMKISIITATWNSEKTLEDTLRSVLSQSYPNYEHIIIDGGSKDGTIDLVKRYEPSYKGRLIWSSEPDNGIYDAMNKGLQKATGDIIGILNSDDFYFGPDSLMMVVKGLSDDRVDAVYADNVIVDCDNTDRVIRRHINSDFKPSQMKYGFMPSHPTFYCRKKIYDKLGGFDTIFKIGADFDWLLRAIYVNKINIKYQPGNFTIMRSGGVSQSGLQSHITIVKEHLYAYKKYGVKSNVIFEIYRLTYKYFCKIFKLSY